MNVGKQIEIKIGEVMVPVIIHRDKNYYPVSYISSKVLLRNSSIITKDKRDYYKTKIFKIDYGHDTGGIQEVICINENDLREIINGFRLGSMSSEQRKNLNYLREYLKMETVNDGKRILDKVDYNNYNEFIKDAIEEVLNDHPDIKWQMCSKCNNYYPMHDNFYSKNNSSTNIWSTVCRDCASKNLRIKSNDEYLSSIYYKYGEDVYKIYKDHDTINIYLHYLNNKLNKVPKLLRNKDDYLTIIKWLIDKDKINKFEINQSKLINEFGLKNIENILPKDTLHIELFGENYYLYPWRYNSQAFRYRTLTYDIANQIFDNYIKEYNLIINDVLNFSYSEVIKKTKLIKNLSCDSLYFAVQYNNFKYPGYMFKTVARSYYKDECNLLFDLKYLIEQDMKLEIHKIPLYLTKGTLHKKCPQLYNYIVTKKHENLFYWVDKLYPNQFIEADFDMNPYRNEFDSDTELYIHEILKERFKSVIYNQRNTEHTIEIDGMVPDWFVFTSSGVWIIEYFGMYSERYCDSSRVKVYLEKMNNKIEKYKKVKGYNLIFLYPEDIEDDYKGCRIKLDQIT